MKKIVIVFSALMLMMVSCNFNSPTKPENHQVLNAYVGKCVVDSGYTNDMVIDFITSDSIAGAYVLYFHDAKFAEKMPQMDIIVDGIMQVDNNRYEGNAIIPDMVMGIMKIPVEKYIFNNLVVQFSNKNGKQHMSITTDCGGYLLEFEGDYDGE